MRNLSLGVAAASLMIVLMSGCANSPAVTRGQSPDAMSYRAPSGPIQRARYDGYGNTYSEAGFDGGYCDPNGNGRRHCAPPQCYKFKYVVPQGLNYPPPNAMPGMVQYPYYTVKGPDCFFHQ